MKRRVYIETKIPSFYFEPRTEPEMIARREWTRKWWREAAPRFDLVTSAAVLDELSRGDFASRPEQSAQPLDRLHGYALAPRLAAPHVHQPLIPLRRVAPLQTSHLARA